MGRRMLGFGKAQRLRVSALSAVAALMLGVIGSATTATANWLVVPEWKVVRATTATAVALAWAAEKDLWVAEKRADGRLVLEHLVGTRWSSTVLPVAVAADLAIDAAGPADVWLVNGGRLWSFNGHRWGEVALPVHGRAARGDARVTSLVAVPGASTYVGLVGRGLSSGNGVYQLRNGRWQALGGPAANAGRSWTPVRLRLQGTGLFAGFQSSNRAGTETADVAFRRTATGWARMGTLATSKKGWSEQIGAWVFTSPGSYEVLGRVKTGMNDYTLCRQGTTTTEPTACSTKWQVEGGGEYFLDQYVVAGAREHTSGWPGSPTKAVFAMRYAYGDYSTMLGSPGDEVIAMDTQPVAGFPWAITRTGTTTYLQRLSMDPPS